MDYIRSMPDTAVPVICVNYRTGTPDEAAAWVHYANVVKNYNIRFWQIGNEMDGNWEEGSPVSAGMYSERFLLFAKAMKKADSTIRIFGQLLSNAEFFAKNSGSYDGKSWMQEFIEIIGKQEKADNKKYCDGVDFYSYPYWAFFPDVSELFSRTDFLYEQTDNLRKWIDSYLIYPESVYIMMSEFNSIAANVDLLQKSFNGVFVADYCSHYLLKRNLRKGVAVQKERRLCYRMGRSGFRE